MKNIVIKVENEFTANVVTNAIKAVESTETTVSVNKKSGIARNTGKLILSIPEANTLSAALETYAKTTTHAASAKLAKVIAFACRMKTANACKASKAEFEAEMDEMDAEAAAFDLAYIF